MVCEIEGAMGAYNNVWKLHKKGAQAPFEFLNPEFESRLNLVPAIFPVYTDSSVVV